MNNYGDDNPSWYRGRSDVRGRYAQLDDSGFGSSAGSGCRGHSLPRTNVLDRLITALENPSAIGTGGGYGGGSPSYDPQSDRHRNYSSTAPPERPFDHGRDHHGNYGSIAPSGPPNSYHHNRPDHGTQRGPDRSLNTSGYGSMPAGDNSMRYENRSGADTDEERRYPTDNTICGLHPVAFTALAITGMAYEKAKTVVETAIMCPIVTGWVIGTHYGWIQN